MSVQTYIYKSLKKQGAYIYLDKMDNFEVLPQPLLQALGKLEWVMNLKLEPQTRLALADARQVIADLQQQHYYFQYHDPSVMEQI